MQNDMPMIMLRSKSKPEIEFQYGGRPFSKNGNSYILAVDWDISSKFGIQIHFHLLKQILSLNPQPKVDFRLYGRHAVKSIWRHNSADDLTITTKFGRQMQNDMPMIEIETGNRIPIWRPSVFKHRNSFISAVDWDISSKFGMQIDFHLLKQMLSPNLKPGVDFRLYSRHLENRYDVMNSPPIVRYTKFGRHM